MDVIIDYTNWRGERGERRIRPLRIYHGASQYHRDPQWIMIALDVSKRAERHFAMAGIHSWRAAPAQ